MFYTFQIPGNHSMMIKLIFNGKEISCSINIALKLKLKINNFITKNHNSSEYTINEPNLNIENDNTYRFLCDILTGQSVKIDFVSFEALREISTCFQIEELQKKLDSFEHMSDVLYKRYKKENHFKLFKKFEQMLIQFDKNNFENIIDFIICNLSQITEKMLFELLYCYFVLSYDDQNQNLIKMIQQLDETICHIYERFKSFLLAKFIHEIGKNNIYNISSISHLICLMLNEKIMDKDKVLEKIKVEIPSLKLPSFFQKIIGFEIETDNHPNILEKKLDEEKAFEYIKNDDINYFQSLISQNNIEINQQYHKSTQDKHYLLNEEFTSKSHKITFIEYASFYGAIKCFKYLLSNHAIINKQQLCKYAISGNHNEIIHLCDQVGCSFLKTLPISIQYHHHSTTKWLIENKKDNIDSDLLFKLCIRYNNYLILKYFLSKGVDISNFWFNSLESDNIINVQFLFPVIDYHINEKIIKKVI
ncbi:hypothetical protein TRFO_38922 [Tritrichomonas foetus]|uniref:DUF3447 domain-containing protein n=1 Tax=Tritrichomonas foetus TaxID=1144522 RepID=A0A1J4JCD5_9EUKA|nr:hypothetical protein TRFO_38922 [Tritrichomonas foetus]|eukprot:OHS94924.1 hypothetical protein TRFO_38922 [Tritrichomonas foetus]